MDFKAIYKHVKFLNFWCFLSAFLHKNSKMSLRPVFSDRGSYVFTTNYCKIASNHYSLDYNKYSKVFKPTFLFQLDKNWLLWQHRVSADLIKMEIAMNCFILLQILVQIFRKTLLKLVLSSNYVNFVFDWLSWQQRCSICY